MASTDRAEALLSVSGALLDGDHFVSISGHHGSGWIDDQLVNLTDIRLDSWPAAECPLCRDGIPVNAAFAHGADYLAAGGHWP